MDETYVGSNDAPSFSYSAFETHGPSRVSKTVLTCSCSRFLIEDKIACTQDPLALRFSLLSSTIHYAIVAESGATNDPLQGGFFFPSSLVDDMG